jgi:hypothetical protein
MGGGTGHSILSTKLSEQQMQLAEGCDNIVV